MITPFSDVLQVYLYYIIAGTKEQSKKFLFPHQNSTKNVDNNCNT